MKQPLTATIPVNSAQVIRHLTNQPSSGLEQPKTAILRSPENKSESNPTANTICPSSEMQNQKQKTITNRDIQNILKEADQDKSALIPDQSQIMEPNSGVPQQDTQQMNTIAISGEQVINVDEKMVSDKS